VLMTPVALSCKPHYLALQKSPLPLSLSLSSCVPSHAISTSLTFCPSETVCQRAGQTFSSLHDMAQRRNHVTSVYLPHSAPLPLSAFSSLLHFLLVTRISDCIFSIPLLYLFVLPLYSIALNVTSM
jgi:hypothetical protein